MFPVLILCRSKRGADNAVNWDAVAYDLKEVDWKTINWNSVFASTPAAAAKPTPTPEEKKATSAAATPTVEAKKVEAPTSAAPSSAKPAESSKAAETSTKTESAKDTISDVVSDIMQGVASISNALGAKVGKNDKSNNGGIWIGSDSAWGMSVTNSGGKDAVFYCWKSNGFTGMIIKDNVPEVSVGIKSGQTVNLSFAAGVSGACAPATDSSKLAMFGGVSETWAEFTFGKDGAFNVSKNVNMKGCSISMKGSKCTSDMSTCVFQCKDTSADSCMTGYDLINCDAGNGGGGGYDTVMQGVGGGCAMGDSGEKIQVSFS